MEGKLKKKNNFNIFEINLITYSLSSRMGHCPEWAVVPNVAVPSDAVPSDPVPSDVAPIQ